MTRRIPDEILRRARSPGREALILRYLHLAAAFQAGGWPGACLETI